MSFDDVALARAIHVLSVVHWIGGVAVVTTIVLPRLRKSLRAEAAIFEFEAFERRFAFQARISILLAGLSGAYLLMALDGGSRDEHRHAAGATGRQSVHNRAPSLAPSASGG